MDRIRQLLAQIKTCAPEDLASLETEINAAFDELSSSDEATAETIAQMDELVTGLQAVRAEVAERDAAAAEVAARREELKSSMEGLRNPPKAEAEETPAAEEAGATAETATPAADETPAEVTGEETPADADGASPLLEGAVTADGGPRGTVPGAMIPAMAGATGRATPSPEQATPASGIALVAAAGIPTRNPGEAFTNRAELAEAMSEKLQRMQTSQDRSSALIASARWDLPEDRQLGNDAQLNTERIEAVCGMNAPRYSRDGQALVATGGICLPVNVDYSVPTWSTADRPLRDALPAFQATRGGIRFVSPPDIGVPDLQGTKSGAGNATTIWTQATDAAPGGATKPVWTVACGSEQLVYVNAVTTRVQFGNMQSRFAPEQIAANTQQAVAISAREAELELLTLMANQTKQVLASKYLGATRDLLASVDIIRAQYIYSHRLPNNIALTAVFPEWTKALFRADLLRETAHDNAGQVNVLAITDGQIEDWFQARGINVIWTADALKAGTYGTGGTAITNQFFPLVSAGAAPQWPGQSSNGAFVLAWFLFVEGTFQFLDGGRLDLGVVRDSVLDATNDYETFVETFEGLAFRGIEALQVQSTILPTGYSAAAQTGTYAE